MIEVELKAWVDDPEAVRARLDARYALTGTFRKEDSYFRLGGQTAGRGAGAATATGAASAEGPREFRIRREAGVATVTSKEKRIVDGVEVNRENEFTVSDPEAFERFARFVGAKPFVRKVKVGRLYDASGASLRAVPTAARDAAPGRLRSLHIELSEVERLGTFIEIEALLDTEEPGEIERARADVRALLASVGVDESRIEPRYYIDMLAELAP